MSVEVRKGGEVRSGRRGVRVCRGGELRCVEIEERDTNFELGKGEHARARGKKEGGAVREAFKVCVRFRAR